MTRAANKPDLSRIGKSAFAEVLSTLLSLPATVGNSASHIPLSSASDQITSTVLLAGARLSGSVRVQLPVPFVAHAFHRITGLDVAARDTHAMLDDAAGELANMVAGRIATQLSAAGYSCTLGTPSVFRDACLAIEAKPGLDHARTEFFCAGHWLSLELHCRYATP